MITLSSLVLACIAVSGAAAVPAGLEEAVTRFWARQGGFYSSNWNDGSARVQFSNKAGGEYSVTWSGDKGNFVCGKGYNPGGPRNVSYTAKIDFKGNAYLSIYGWTTNPLVEYYIVESYGTHKPCSNTTEASTKGNMTSDGGTYELWTKIRRNKPSIQGTATFPQYWSVRTEHRTGGVVTTGNHFNAWTSVGWKLGRHSYMIVAVEGQDSSGSATVTVGTAPKETPAPPPPAPPAASPTDNATGTAKPPEATSPSAASTSPASTSSPAAASPAPSTPPGKGQGQRPPGKARPTGRGPRVAP